MSKSHVIREDPAGPAVDSITDPRTRTLDELTREHHAFLLVLARKLCGRSLDPEDLVQEVMVRAVANLERLSDVRNPQAWLTTVMKHVFLDQLRRAKTRESREARDEPVQALSDVHEGDDAPWWQGLDADHVREAMTALPVELRETFERFAFRHQSYDEIARALSIPKSTVGTRIVRARRRLRVALEERRER